MTSNKTLPWLLALTLTVLGCAYWLLGTTSPPPKAVSAEIEALQDNAGNEGYARAYAPRALVFPADHGPHREFQTEWWYYTGNLETADGRHIGYQLTFFRRALSPEDVTVGRTSAWAAGQVYFAHFAVTDVAGNLHTSTERFSRGAAGLAGAEGTPYRVWLEDWEAVALTPDAGSVRVQARDGGYALDLTLVTQKPPVLHGDGGLSAKSDVAGNASYYVSFTRLAAEGTVTVAGETLAVTGWSWMDHEWSTSVLAEDVVGWDWFSVQLDDGRELMYYHLRRADGTVEPVSGGTLVGVDGTPQRLFQTDVTLTTQGEWRSPRTQAAYPAGWTLTVADLTLTLEPYIADQEMQISFPYWEGAVRVSGQAGGAAVSGVGYVELTGYAR